MGENREYITYPDEKGDINISEEVIAIIAGSAAVEVDGVAGLPTAAGKDIAQIIGKRSLSRGVHISVEGNQITVDVFALAQAGCAVGELGKNVQTAVATAIESTTGFGVKAVNVHIVGIAMKKDK